MKKSFLILLAGFVLLFAACKQSPSKEEFMIKGELTNAAYKMIILQEIEPNQIVNIDTVTADSKGKFVFTQKMPYQSLYNIMLENAEYITLLPNNGETLEITGDWTVFSKTYKVKNSEASEWLWELNQETLKGIVVLDSLSNIWSVSSERENAMDVKKGLDSVFMHQLQEQRQYTLDFIDKHTGSLVSLIALYRSFNEIELLDKRKDFPVYEKIAAALQQSQPNNPHTQSFTTLVEKLKTQQVHAHTDTCSHQ